MGKGSNYIAARVAVCAILLLAYSTAVAVTTISKISLPGDLNAQVLVLSGNGQVIAGQTDLKGWRWTAQGGAQFIGDNIVAKAISADGSSVAGYFLGSNYESFRWTSAGGVQLIDPTPGAYYSYATGISGDGSVVVGLSDVGSYRWTAATGAQTFYSINGSFMTAWSISSDGKVVGGQTPAFGSAALWTSAGGVRSLGDLDGGTSDARVMALSSDGSVAAGVGNSAGGPELFRWTAAGGMKGLGHLPGATNSDIGGMTADGSIIVGMDLTPNGWEPFQWDSAHGLRRLIDAVQQDRFINLLGWHFGGEPFISADGGTMIVSATNPAGVGGTFAVVVPEPGAMVGVLLWGLCLRRRWGRFQN
ncbi:MAG TPA: hypothetical protein VKH44_02655 [Pirellulaceae bacterium]|nr:hypothetical protein [Pirellulaceae bacterium]